MLRFFSKFFKSLERWEYYDPSSFWVCSISVYLCFTTLSNHLLSFSKNPSQAQVVIEEVRSGGQQQHEVINSVANSVKKKKFKEMQVFKMILYKLILLLNELNISLEP